MNQILEYNMNNNGGHKGGGSGNTSDKIVKVFAIILAIFAIFLIGSGVMSLMKNSKETDGIAKKDEQKIVATITATLDEENEVVNIVVDSPIEIDKLIYSWNSEPDHTISGGKLVHMEKPIDLVAGDSTLTIKVIDINNNETKKSFEFESETGKDIINPKVTLGYQGNKLIITAVDETEMSYITYKWNDGDVITVNMDEDAEDKTTLVAEVDILMGENTILITAVDASLNTKIESETLKGVTKPEIEVHLIGENGGDTLEIICRHENGIKEIYYTLNERPYQYIAPEGEINPEIKFTQPLDEGYNRIKLTVTSMDNIPAEFDGECDYYPNGRPEDTEETGDTSADEEETTSGDESTGSTETEENDSAGETEEN